jgi:dTDP-4-dehydrorhamnose reductase
MRWLVTGARGQLGSALLARLAGHRGHGAVSGHGHELDVADTARVEAALRGCPGGPPDVLANAAAFTDVDGCESRREHAARVNGAAPGALAALCGRLGVKLVHVSTDYVFDGSARVPYHEEDPPRPLSVYGRSKLEGERAVLALGGDALVVRTSWVYGRGRNFVAAICERAARRRRDPSAPGLRVVDDQTGSPTWAADLAAGLVGLVEGGARGLYHLANAGAATRWELARAALDHLGWADLPIEAVGTEAFPTPAVRPRYSVLDCTKAANAGVRLRDWREALAAYLDSEDSPLRDAGRAA